MDVFRTYFKDHIYFYVRHYTFNFRSSNGKFFVPFTNTQFIYSSVKIKKI